LSGAVELVGDMLKVPARIGTPIRFANLGGLVEGYRTTAHATAIGLLLEGDRRENLQLGEKDKVIRPPVTKDPRGYLNRILAWFKEIFY